MSEPLVISASPVETLTVDLVDVRYEIKPPKAALAMKFASESKTFQDNPQKMMALLDEWVARAFGKREAEKVRKRLDDENDALDIQQIMELMEAVMERQTGNPTSSSPATRS